MSLLGFEGAAEVLPFLFAPIVILAIIIVIVVAVAKRASAEKRRREMEEYKARSQYTDGNGRTQQQRDYLNAKRRELADKKLAADNNSHSHRGKTERYEPIVGSLGEVNDEGCDELDGVRLIEHDESYCDDPDHIITSDPTDLERAIVLGEVLNTPRYKQPYRHK